MHHEDDKGGYLVPGVIRVPREGVLGDICRFFNHKYGWVEFNFVEYMKEKIYESEVKAMLQKTEKEFLNATYS